MIILEKITEIDLESRRNTASVVLTPRVSETATQSLSYATDNFSCCAPTAEGNFFGRTSLFEDTRHADSERSTAEGNFQLLSESKKEERQLSKERTTRQTQNLSDREKQITQKS